MSEETDREIQQLKQQLALLQQESARTRTGWLNWMRMTGFLLRGLRRFGFHLAC